MITVIFLLLSSGQAQNEEPIVISAEARPQSIYIGDRFMLEIRVEYSEDYLVRDVQPPLDPAPVEILDIGTPEDMQNETTGNARIFPFTLSIYDIGEFTVPSFEVRYETPEGEIKTAPSPEVDIKVKEIPPSQADTDDIRTMKGPREIEARPYFRNFLIMLAAILTIIAIAVYLLVRHLKKRPKKEKEVFVPARPAHEVALEELEALESSNLITEGRIKEYYTRACDIIRIYLGSRFRINAIDMTSFELEQAIDETSFNKDLKQVLGEFLERCDMVKFAKYRPEEFEHDETIQQARRIVKETMKIKQTVQYPEKKENGKMHTDDTELIQSGVQNTGGDQVR